MSDTVIYIIGTLGNILFGFKSLFQVIECYKKKSTRGLSLGMLLADFGGNVACAYFIFATTGFKLFPQYINYGFASLWLIVLFILMFKYRHNKGDTDSVQFTLRVGRDRI